MSHQWIPDPLKSQISGMMQVVAPIRFSMSTDHGQIELSVPREMSPDDFRDFEESMVLVMRGLKRRFERQAAPKPESAPIQ